MNAHAAITWFAFHSMASSLLCWLDYLRLHVCLNFVSAVFNVFALMTRSHGALFICIILSATASKIMSAEPNWAGDYANKKFLNGEAVLQFSIEQSANAIKIAFDAAYNDAHGAAPDGEGQATITGKNTLEFKWEDSFKNSGTGTIMQTGGSIIVSMKTMRVADSRCLAFYGQKMRLKRVEKGT